MAEAAVSGNVLLSDYSCKRAKDFLFKMSVGSICFVSCLLYGSYAWMNHSWNKSFLQLISPLEPELKGRRQRQTKNEERLLLVRKYATILIKFLFYEEVIAIWTRFFVRTRDYRANSCSLPRALQACCVKQASYCCLHRQSNLAQEPGQGFHEPWNMASEVKP